MQAGTAYMDYGTGTNVLTQVIGIKANVSAGNWQGICGLYEPAGVDGQAYADVLVNPSGYLVVGTAFGGSFHSVADTVNIMDGNSHMVAVTWNGYALTGYRDGVNIGSDPYGTDSGGPIYPTCGYATTGAYPAVNPYYWDGYLQSYVVWAAALSDSNIATLWASFDPDHS